MQRVASANLFTAVVLALVFGMYGCNPGTPGPTHATPESAKASDGRFEALNTLTRPQPKAVTSPTRAKLEKFASADAIDAYLKSDKRSPRSPGAPGLIGTGMGGGGTGEETTGLGSSGTGSGYGKGAGSSSPPPGWITNNQETDVDEGGIVKTHGDHLVVLRRGRLFTVKVGDDTLAAVDGIDIGSGRKHQAWYDEMLVHRDTVIVIGYSYEFGATEVVRFSVSRAGKLRHTETDYLRSNDYYSSRNYASRLIGNKLVFYMPHGLAGGWPTSASDDQAGVPSMCRPKAGKCETWRGIVKATEVYQPLDGRAATVLHTVVTCDLSKGMRCEGRGILGPYSRNFYVASDAVYVWVNDPTWTPPPPWSPAAASLPTDSVVYRLGLTKRTVSALRTHGAPVDQFSFQRSASGHLNVLVRAVGAGDAMWAPEHSASQDVALLRAPLSVFVAGEVATADRAAYRDLPDPVGATQAFHNRFVGDAVLYGTGVGWGRPSGTKSELHIHKLRGAETTTIKLDHPVDRIEPMEGNAVVVGASGKDLHFVAIDLRAEPKAAGTFTQPDANQGETRSHGFFYRPTSRTTGMVGLPIQRGGNAGHRQLSQVSAELLYLRVSDLGFERLGTLASDAKANRKDGCHTSCVDWYGNARPVFYGDRVMALLGYEVVEGKTERGKFSERRRTSMLPALRKR